MCSHNFPFLTDDGAAADEVRKCKNDIQPMSTDVQNAIDVIQSKDISVCA